ncbi:hypothetical protein M378DRAFT_97131 [Amanita muscaria Koide BX008]|uniref:AMP-dependent synthetase/ligase domain-containing protein n=1 Tax=Amanita muscaria (strain Koide BX008) TaxID=946122 RepID=A0A0C2TQK1_AMAMK|nr:hypothetical protein M378DRAFT_97131 [Amanita muscaria Koide BX008]
MTTTLSDHIVTDDLTILLGLVAATVFLLNNLYKPQSLVHPILLGRQSDVARARNPGESAIYRNYSTGLMGRFPLRLGKDVNILADLVKPEVESPRTLWSTKITNSQLQDRAAALAAGLVRLAGLRPNDSRAFLLLNDGIEFVLSDFALASLSIISHTVSALNLLPSIFERHPAQAIFANAAFLPQLLELLKGRSINYTVIVVGEVGGQISASVPANVRILQFSDVERSGRIADNVTLTAPQASDVFTTLFHGEESGHIREIQFTHENMIAGVAATRALLPSSSPLTTLDTVVSAHSLGSIYGRVVAYTAVYEGTSFTTLTDGSHSTAKERGLVNDLKDVLSYKDYSIPSPTVLFITANQLKMLVSRIDEEASTALLYPLAMRHKKAGIAEGFVSKESLWDRFVFDGARVKILGDVAGTLRSVIVSDGYIDGGSQTKSRVVLSVPLVHCFTDCAVAGPVLASHPHDLQEFPLEKSESRAAHAGPPSVNVEVKLTGVEDEAVEKGGDPEGFLVVRGPSVGREVGLDEGWVETGERFRVRTNGAFQPVA